MSQAIATAVPATSNRGLRITLWAVQIVLGGVFMMAGLFKATQPFDVVSAAMPWPAVVGEGLTRFIGVSEFLGGIGLLLPAATRIRPGLTALAGAGLALVMVLAMGFHTFRGEFAVLPFNLVLGSLAAFVAWGRFRKAPIRPRSEG